jgi:uncharacterized membrane protein
MPPEMIRCAVCGNLRRRETLIDSELLSERTKQSLQLLYPSWQESGLVCRCCRDEARTRTVLEAVSKAPTDRASDAEKVLESVEVGGFVALGAEGPEAPTMAREEVMADGLVRFISHWSFATGLLALIAGWLVLNATLRPFEPYPTIMVAGLSAATGALAALQGPIILLNQRVHMGRDARRARNNFRVNLKAELEVRELSENVEALLRAHQTLRDELARLNASCAGRERGGEGLT